MNIIVLVGRLVEDPELRYTPAEGVPVASFTIAVDRPFTNQKGEQEADFIRVVTWRKQAENCASYLSKGRQVAVEGSLQIRSFDDREGIRRKSAEVVARRVQFLGGGRRESEEEFKRNLDQGDAGDTGGDSEIQDDEVPF